MSTKNCTIEYKNASGTYIPLYPKTSQTQVENWDIGELFGPFIINLSANAWLSNEQSVWVRGLSETDTPCCVKVLEGDKETMILQDKEYAKLRTIESAKDTANFTCDEKPTRDIKLQIWWTR